MRLLVAIIDRCTINRGGRGPMVRSIDRCILRPIVGAIVASCDRAYDQSWHPKTDVTINRRVQRSIAQSIVASCDRSYDQSLQLTTDRNRRLEIVNMTNAIVATDLPHAITHDLCDQSYVLSTICLRCKIVLVAATW